MYRANAGAGQHRDRGFRYHRHINRNYVTFFNAQFEQGIGEAADVAVQLFIADMFALAGVVAFPDDGGTIAVFLQMAVKAVCRQIQRAVLVPFNGHITGGKGGVFHLLVRFDPVENFSLFAPEGIWCVNRLLIHRLVLLRVYQATVCDVGRNGVFVNLTHAFVLLVRC